MSDFEFEARLERLFAQPPRVTDAEVFCRQVQARLDRDWTFRRTLIGAAGVVGGLFAASQALGSDVMERLAGVRLTAPALEEAALRTATSSEGLGAFAAGGELVWLATALLVLAAAFTATRMVDTI